MLRHVSRRLWWIFPSALGASLAVFYALSLLPAAAERSASPHVRYRQLPLFFNPRPADLRTKVGAAVQVLLAAPDASVKAQASRAELVRLGGAALPLLMSDLDALEPAARLRLALALAPLAKRMQLDGAEQAADARAVVRFWGRFWETSEIEFRPATAAGAARRYALYGTEARARELYLLDTFALPAIFAILPAQVSGDNLPAVRRLLAALAHIAERADTPAANGTLAPAQACLDRWRRWWLIARADFVQLTGSQRLAAFALETRYGKWALEALSMRAGGESMSLLARRAGTTGLVLLGWLLAYFLALPLGALAAARRARAVERVIGWGSLVPYALPVAAGAIALSRLLAPLHSPLPAACCALGLSMLASPLRQQRAGALWAAHQEWMTTALATGASPLGAAFGPALVAAALPVAAQAWVELPAALTGAFVVERAFALAGLGEPTMAAAAHGDATWLMALAVVGAAWGVVSLALGDVASGLIDPRTTLLRHGKRA